MSLFFHIFTQTPTLRPTISPTLSPSLTPTLSPTLSPSLSPTLVSNVFVLHCFKLDCLSHLLLIINAFPCQCRTQHKLGRSLRLPAQQEDRLGALPKSPSGRAQAIQGDPLGALRKSPITIGIISPIHLGAQVQVIPGQRNLARVATLAQSLVNHPREARVLVMTTNGGAVVG